MKQVVEGQATALTIGIKNCPDFLTEGEGTRPIWERRSDTVYTAVNQQNTAQLSGPYQN